MDNPPVNALSRVLNDELTLALDRISEMDEIRVVVLTGAGKVFCAGADLKGRAENIKGPGDFIGAHSRRTRECFHAIRECAKPVVVGHQRCRARLGAGDGGFGRRPGRFGEGGAGLAGGRRRPARRLSPRDATVRSLAAAANDADRLSRDGAELYRLGIVEACTSPEELMPTALEIARTIASKSPVSTRMGKHTLNTIEDMSLRDGYRYEQDMTQRSRRPRTRRKRSCVQGEARAGFQRALARRGIPSTSYLLYQSCVWLAG